MKFDLSFIATGRKESFFKEDIEINKNELMLRIQKSRILVIGGAGSIGSATTREIVKYLPNTLHIVDINENNLTELVRDLRGSVDDLKIPDFKTIPVDFGSEIFHRFLLEQEPYDYVLNFAALKHVRSEKDIYSLLQMIDTNIIKQAKLLHWLAEVNRFIRYFAVSTDKAANPVNLMGATKRLMEHVMFSSDVISFESRVFNSARFANVAFSDGSLLYGWTQRLLKGQPLAVPINTYRYFISLEEAGHICLLASILGNNNQLLIPKLDPKKDLHELVAIAKDFLIKNGFEPIEYHNEYESKVYLMSDIEKGFYPLLLTPLNTSGEKPYEEFVGDEETVINSGLVTLDAIDYIPAPTGSVRRFIEITERAIHDPQCLINKEEIIKLLKDAIPLFNHVQGKNLDERL